QGMTGACLLSARTALQLGCGRVALSLLSEADMHLPDIQRQGQVPLLDLVFPEIMNKPLELNLDFADTAIVGPGLGQGDEALQWLYSVLKNNKGLDMVWDADALNLLAANPQLRAGLKNYREQHPDKALVLTPHPLEAARLLQTTTELIQDRRLETAREISDLFDCTVVLKGAGTVVCNTAGAEINLTGGPALGTAGSGDVLAGAIGAMMGQGLNGFDAAAFAVYLHGLAVGPTGAHGRLHVSHASEIAQRMKYCLNSLLDKGTCSNQ
ncbi:MAG TPA: NAD(P)H-hydrate dehydratase, partial [Limnobacter sp.]|nr:NAD(P)H-hydrate dehydratase [Limnobacter sp.]